MKTLIQSAVVTMFAASAAQAQQAVQWRVEDGGNGHWYLRIPVSGGIGWSAAMEGAHSRGAHLVSITSAGENAFLVSNGAQPYDLLGASTPTDQGCHSSAWKWASGEPWSFTNWALHEPSLHCQETVLVFAQNQFPKWNNFYGGSNGYWIEWSADCNSDGFVDYGQIRDGQLPDANSNGVPDGCDVLRVPQDFTTIQAAVDAAVAGATVSVAPGTYAPFSFNGKKITVESESGAHTTRISASDMPISAVEFGVGATFDTRLRGFTIITGRAGAGGGVLLNGDGTAAGSCDGTIEDCLFLRGEGIVGYGGGLYAGYGNVVVRRCVFDGLAADHFHGGMGIAMTDYSSVPGMPGVGALIEDCEFRNCTSWNNGALGIRGIQSSKAVLRRVLFAGNSSPFSTGALLTGSPGLDGTPTSAILGLDIDRCVFVGNSGPFSAGVSEGIPYPVQFVPMTITITGSIFADAGIALIARGNTQVRVENSQFCSGFSAIGSPISDLGGNSFACQPMTDCDGDGLPDAFAITLGRVDDQDGDGIPDSCPLMTCASADLTGDGLVGGADLGVVLSNWGAASNGNAADLDRDGSVGGSDLGYLLSQWGPCPN